jgi:RNA exonuclease 4
VPGSNWAALQAANLVPKQDATKAIKGGRTLPAGDAPARPDAVGSAVGATRVLAVDCEMVGVGPGGARSSLARVCIVNDAGSVLLDTMVAQRERVTDWRTRVSGITRGCLVGAPPPDVVRARVASLVQGRILVGHAITHDLTALLLGHPRALIRDTARFPPLMRATAPGRRPKPRKLRDLAAEHLGLAIQDGAHSPVDDARAALYLYKRFRKQWEAALTKGGGIHKLAAPLPVRGGGKKAGEAAAAALARLAERDEMADV